jgi:subtilisin-like proprotein convertase family protein
VVNEVNQAPVIQPIANQTVLVGQTVTANVLANDADLPANSLTYSLDAGAPAGAAISGAGLFTWTPSSSGTNVISVIVSDNGDPSLSATNTFTVVANYFTQNYTNNSNISIPGSGSAGLYPSTIVASGSLGHIQKVVVTLVGFTHPRPADVDVLLVSPSGSSVLLMSDCGGSSLLTNAITLTLDDAAASNLTTATPVTGTFKPTDLVGVADTFVAPSPTSGWSTTLSSLNGTVADGTWRLYVRDNQTGPAGTGVTARFTGYRLTITSVP